ncbi:orotidine-5'-phosphate decarboxylase [Aquisalibacillus elongatus]|uniref:Orotidine 5'-phosphate decarboxylase n=1 Tax=Aquisalibacillus elongatus TaxID=485577 RepID=A0A3N5BEZ5_9BACI|nr:orotidine-5'-phosphate decarboxylase [Aquisalibacillus elongatus]RPF56053.1 orotidine-5'-phosphate decarboxylase [Aquisalibacillus elongatus]
MKSSIYIALDFETKDEALDFLNQNELHEVPVKVGMQLFYKEGPSFIQSLKEKGHPIFLDLKLHDIPNTVYHAMKSLASLEVDLVNVHASGGLEMMKAAKEGLEDTCGKQASKLIAVTQLTSTSEEVLSNELLINQPMDQVVRSYAQMAQKAGLDGVVSSVWEAQLIKESCGESFVTVTPGIRLINDATQDQKRIATPEQASHSDFLVMGRSITTSRNPKKAYEQALKEWKHEYRQTTH